jgi:putative membrane protein
MNRIFHAAVTAAAVWALAVTPSLAQSSSDPPAGGATPGSSSGATDQAGSQPGSDGVTGTGPRGTDQGGTAGTSGQKSGKADEHAGMSKGSAFDRAFIEKAAAGGLAEVELGKLASGQASSSDVKKFGEMMVTDHSKANSQLMQIADAQQATPPKTLRPKDQAFYDRLSKMSGDEFDRAYMAHMVEDHEKDVAEFQKASTTASDASLKKFAADTLPVLQKHLQDARQVSRRIGHGAKGTSGTTSGSGAHDEPGAGTGHGSTSPTGTTPPRPPRR